MLYNNFNTMYKTYIVIKLMYCLRILNPFRYMLSKFGSFFMSDKFFINFRTLSGLLCPALSCFFVILLCTGLR